MSKCAVIGIDPGLMTGMFIYHYVPDPFGGMMHWCAPVECSANAFPYKFREALRAGQRLAGSGRVHVAVERFIITPRTAKLSQQPDALEVTGMVRYAMTTAGLGGPRRYSKSNLKYASDDALRRAWWWTSGARHANDAARQAFALLKDVDYPLWCRVSEGGMLESADDDRGETT